jgi:hypothetical protein
MLETLLNENGTELLAALTGSGGLDANQAESLLPAALNGIGDAVSGGGLDLGSLMGGGGEGITALLGKLDIAGIASSAGLETGQAQTGLTSLIPVVLSLLGNEAGGAGGAEGILSLLGGAGGTSDTSDTSAALGALGGIAGKLFGK